MDTKEYVLHLSLGNTCSKQEVKEGWGWGDGGWKV